MVTKKFNSQVAVVKCSEYSKEKLSEKIEELLELLGGIESLVKKGDKVLLKPNMFRTSKDGTTNPMIIYAIAETFKNAGAKIYLTDSPMTQTLDTVAEFTGIKDVCSEIGIKILPIKSIIEKSTNNSEIYKKFFLPSFLDDMDLIINIPKLKAHPLTVFSGSVKNLFGLCQGITKSQFHLKFKKKYDFCQMLLDLYSIVKPELTIMDAVYGTDCTLKAKKIGYILGSKDVIALDSTACRIVGIPPELVLTNKIGNERGLGVMNEKNIQIVGDSAKILYVNGFKYEINHHEVISSLTTSFFDSTFLKKSFGKPFFSDKCKKCGLCLEICPNNAITSNNKKLNINYNLCIRCYCCQEICPNDALLIKKPNQVFFSMLSIIQEMILKFRSIESERKNK